MMTLAQKEDKSGTIPTCYRTWVCSEPNTSLQEGSCLVSYTENSKCKGTLPSCYCVNKNGIALFNHTTINLIS